VKRTPAWSHGILLVLVGIVFSVVGLLWALVLPARGASTWSLMVVGIATITGGVLTAFRAAPTRDRSLPANDKRLPPARALPRR
jgi:hypothetical protein